MKKLIFWLLLANPIFSYADEWMETINEAGGKSSRKLCATVHSEGMP